LVSEIQTATTNAGVRTQGGLTPDFLALSVRWDVLDERLSSSFDQDKIAAEKLFDGCYIVSGEVPKEISKGSFTAKVAPWPRPRLEHDIVPP